MRYTVMYMQRKNTLNQKFQVWTSHFSTSVCGTPNEQAVATTKSVEEGGTDASKGDVGPLFGQTYYKQ